MSRDWEKTSEETKYAGKLGTVRIETHRHADGEEVTREVVAHPGAVGILAHDETHVWLVRQPREAVGERTLEVPAGKYDVDGEDPLATAKRELAEEVGLAAGEWTELPWFFTSPGFTDERVDLYEATGLSTAQADAEEEERIEIIRWPLDDLDAAIAQCHDSKSLIALLLLRIRLP